MLGAIFKKARQDIQNPATLRRLIVELIDTENWSSMQADTKGDIYEGLLGKSARKAPKARGSTLRLANSSKRSSMRPPDSWKILDALQTEDQCSLSFSGENHVEARRLRFDGRGL